MDSSLILQFTLLLTLTLINAFFAGAEMAIVSVNKSKIHHLAQEGHKKAIKIEKVLDDPSRFLSTIQIAITLAGFFSSASAATGLSQVVAPILAGWGIAAPETVAMIVITILLSFFTLVFGELVPKRIALQKAEFFAMASIDVVHFVSIIASPFIKVLSLSTNGVLHLFGMKSEGLEEEITREEIRSLIEEGQQQGLFKENEIEMLTSVIEFNDVLAKEIMVARNQVFAIDLTQPTESFIYPLLESKYARVPVYEGDIDNIIGILYMRDFILEAYQKGFDQVDFRSLLHEPYFVPETKKIDELFYELQSKKIVMAILIDEYGGFSGIVTMEDLVEEVMGEIRDDSEDDDEPSLKQISENTYIVSGLYAIHDLTDDLKVELESENADTVSGYIIDRLGYIPTTCEKQQVHTEELTFTVLEVQERTIQKAQVTVHKKETNEKESQKGTVKK